MANTYTKISIQFVFAVKYRQAIIIPQIKDEIYSYIAGILRNKEQKVLAINGTSDHIHLFVGYKPRFDMTELMRDIKSDSSIFINKKKLTRCHFEWQDGYGAFSYSPWDKDKIINYIRNQEEHHKKVKFLTEYRRMLEEFNIDYDDRYIFHEI